MAARPCARLCPVLAAVRIKERGGAAEPQLQHRQHTFTSVLAVYSRARRQQVSALFAARYMALPSDFGLDFGRFTVVDPALFAKQKYYVVP